ncbi:MAG: DUF2283 domain-containing protein [Caldiserica bacterium]|nr:DUF2283 domain-containing protein [Caldisericota bacterium]
MRITYDSKYDVLYLQFKEEEEVLCKHLTEEITMDLDKKGKIVGIEILSASKYVDLGSLLPVESEKKSVA